MFSKPKMDEQKLRSDKMNEYINELSLYVDAYSRTCVNIIKNGLVNNSFEFARMEQGIIAHSRRIDALKKIKNSEPIMKNEHDLLLMMSVFKEDPYIADYQNIENVNTFKP